MIFFQRCTDATIGFVFLHLPNTFQYNFNTLNTIHSRYNTDTNTRYNTNTSYKFENSTQHLNQDERALRDLIQLLLKIFWLQILKSWCHKRLCPDAPCKWQKRKNSDKNDKNSCDDDMTVVLEFAIKKVTTRSCHVSSNFPKVIQRNGHQFFATFAKLFATLIQKRRYAHISNIIAKWK